MKEKKKAGKSNLSKGTLVSAYPFERYNSEIAELIYEAAHIKPANLSKIDHLLVPRTPEMRVKLCRLAKAEGFHYATFALTETTSVFIKLP